MNTKKKKDSQKEQHLDSLDEDLLSISDEIEDQENDLSYLNQPILVIVKDRKKIRKKHIWAIPL